MAVDFQAKFGMTIHQRARELMEEERKANPVEAWWYLSYAHKTEGFKGGVIIQGYGFVWACHNARLLYITPRDVETRGMGPIPTEEMPGPEYRNRLLTKDELSSFWKMATMGEWEEKDAE
jgi:hypothetical protein